MIIIGALTGRFAKKPWKPAMVTAKVLVMDNHIERISVNRV